jgi:hypothetical protein
LGIVEENSRTVDKLAIQPLFNSAPGLYPFQDEFDIGFALEERMDSKP